MRQTTGISLIIVALLGLVWGAFWGPLVPSKDKLVGFAQQRIALEQQKTELRTIIACVNKNPNVTLVDASFSPALSIPAPRGRTLLLTIAYTIDLKLDDEIKHSSFGEAHRDLFICALALKSEWSNLRVYYLDFKSAYVFDDTKLHIYASVTLSIATSREFVERAVLEKNIYALLMASVGYATDTPQPLVVLSDLRSYGIGLSRKAANGNVDLALKRYQEETAK